MAENSSIANSGTARFSRLRAFRPLFYWLLISSGLLAWDYHRQHAPMTTLIFNVRVDGQAILNPSDYSATIGKSRLQSGSVVPVGWRKLRVTAPDTEPVETPLFIQYGENQVGDIDLKWNRGLLELKIEPPVQLVELIGLHYRLSLKNSSGLTSSVPVGDYHVTASFKSGSEQSEVRIRKGDTSPVYIRPSLGMVHVSSEPTGAKFSLSAEGRTGFSAEGDAPAMVSAIPEGKYRLRAWRGDYLKELSLVVKKWDTNAVNVVFDYGEIEVLSEPDGATLSIGGKEAGKTPIRVTELKPQTYPIVIEKTGFARIEIDVEVFGSKLSTVKTNLFNLRFADAIASARREASGLSPDCRRALGNIEIALKEKPGDPEALALKLELEQCARGQQEREALQAKRAEVDGRKRSAGQAFEKATADIRQVELFDTHRWEFQSELTKVREGLLQAFGKSVIPWTVAKEVKLDSSTIAFYCKPKGMIVLGRQCVVLANQVDVNEVVVYAKFWDYDLGNKVSVNLFKGVTPESLVPIHKNYFPEDQAATIDARRRNIAEDFRNHIQAELR